MPTPVPNREVAVSVDPMVFRAIAVRAALRMLAVGVKPNRAWTLGKCLRMAEEITGKRYPRHRGSALIAAQNIKEILDAKQ